MKIKFLFFLAFISILNLQYRINAQSDQWARSAGGNGWEIGRSCATDLNGNVFITGGFFSSNITFGNYSLTNAGFEDVFIVKYDNFGNVLWAKTIAGVSFEEGRGCTTDGNGNIFVIGTFDSFSLNFGDTILANTGSLSDVFVVKYDTDGNVLWVKAIGGDDSEAAENCTTDTFGNVFITGSFRSNSLVFGNDTLTWSGGEDMFIAKYDMDGNILWAKSSEGIKDEYGLSCSTDYEGNVFVSGYFNDSSVTFGNITLTCTGWWNDMFIVKYDKDGNVLWVKSAKGNENDEALDCATDNNGNVFITGSFVSDSISFDSITLINAYPSNGDMFIVKYDNNGNVLWVKSTGSYGVYGSSCITDANDNLFVTGGFGPPLTFGNATLTNTGLYGDMFIVKYDTNGNVLWAKSAGGNDDDGGYSISSDINGNVSSENGLRINVHFFNFLKNIRHCKISSACSWQQLFVLDVCCQFHRRGLNLQ